MAPSWMASLTLVSLAAAVNVVMTTAHRDAGVADDVSVSSTGSVTVNGEVRSDCRLAVHGGASSTCMHVHGEHACTTAWPGKAAH